MYAPRGWLVLPVINSLSCFSMACEARARDGLPGQCRLPIQERCGDLSGHFREDREHQMIALLYPENIPHPKRFRLCPGLAGLVEVEQAAKRVFGGIAF